MSLFWIIDAGHGGADTGAVGNGLVEKDEVFGIQQEIIKLLPDGAPVAFVRHDDSFASPHEKARIANQIMRSQGLDKKQVRLISMHYNAATVLSGRGFEVFSAGTTSGKALAAQAHGAIWPVVQSLTRDRGLKESAFTILTNTLMPAALIEFGFVTNANDAAFLKGPYIKTLFAKAILYDLIGLPRSGSIREEVEEEGKHIDILLEQLHDLFAQSSSQAAQIQNLAASVESLKR